MFESTQFLNAIEAGNPQAAAQLLTAGLRRIATARGPEGRQQAAWERHGGHVSHGRSIALLDRRQWPTVPANALPGVGGTIPGAHLQDVVEHISNRLLTTELYRSSSFRPHGMHDPLTLTSPARGVNFPSAPATTL
jgi:hypothetical protein